jgi:hypothetical protein
MSPNDEKVKSILGEEKQPPPPQQQMQMFLIPADLLQEIADLLQQRPWKEVNRVLARMTQLRPIGR